MAARKGRVEDAKFQAGPVEEKLDPLKAKEPGEELEEVDDESGPEYKREEIGPRLQDHALNVADKETVEELKEKLDHDDLVPLLFPRKVMLQDKGLMHIWDAGVHLVPASLAGHWYLKQHKVRRAGAVVKAAKAE